MIMVFWWHRASNDDKLKSIVGDGLFASLKSSRAISQLCVIKNIVLGGWRSTDMRNEIENLLCAYVREGGKRNVFVPRTHDFNWNPINVKPNWGCWSSFPAFNIFINKSAQLKMRRVKMKKKLFCCFHFNTQRANMLALCFFALSPRWMYKMKWDCSWKLALRNEFGGVEGFVEVGKWNGKSKLK